MGFEFSLKFGKDKAVAGNSGAKSDSEIVNKTSYLRDFDASLDVRDSFYTSLVRSGVKSNLDLLLYFYNNVSEINSIITYIAQKGSDIPVNHVKILANKKQKDLGETDILKKLRKPNSLNNGRTFLINCISSYFVFGYIPLNKVMAIGWLDVPQELFLLPANNFYPIPEKSMNIYGLPTPGVDFRTNKITKYRLFIDDVPFDFKPEEILMVNDSNITFNDGAYLTGQSRLYSAIRSIKTLDAIYDTVNTLISDKGAAGFLTRRSKAGEIDNSWWDNSDDKQNVENKLYSYGTTRGKRPIGVSTADLGFVRLSVPVNEFMPIELKQHEFRTLATALIFPSVLLNDQEGSIYNNVSLAQKAFYTDCLQPVINLFYQSLSEWLGLSAKGEALVPNWDDIDCLQDDKKLQAETETINDKLWKDRYESNLITLNDYLTAIGLPTVPNGNMYARDNKDIPLAVRIGVGGTQSLQAILSDPNLSIEQKVSIIIVVFGMSKEEASLITVNNTQDNGTQAV